MFKRYVARGVASILARFLLFTISNAAYAQNYAPQCVSYGFEGQLVVFVNQCNQNVVITWHDSGSCESGCGTGVLRPGGFFKAPIQGRFNYTAQFWP
jgi:hypothetical protein